MTRDLTAAAALTDALIALDLARRAINEAMDTLSADQPAPPQRRGAVERTTGIQVLAVMGASRGPMTLIDIADGVIALRRDEDEPRRRGGTRYQELVRNALLRLIAKGLVERVEPANKRGLMMFRRTEAVA